MINKLHSLIYRPEKGWDPVPEAHAVTYAEEEWKKFDPSVVDLLERRIDGLAGKRVLDLGGGAGQFSIEFAKRGAVVTWHDISSSYLRIVQQHAAAAGVDLQYSIGYLEEADKFLAQPFDLVFNRICWYYCMNDRNFANLVYELTKPGGACYIDTNISGQGGAVFKRRFVNLLNDYLYFKVGHPFPPHGRIARLFQDKDIELMIMDYCSARNDRILFVRSTL